MKTRERGGTLIGTAPPSANGGHKSKEARKKESQLRLEANRRRPAPPEALASVRGPDLLAASGQHHAPRTPEGDGGRLGKRGKRSPEGSISNLQLRTRSGDC